MNGLLAVFSLSNLLCKFVNCDLSLYRPTDPLIATPVHDRLHLPQQMLLPHNPPILMICNRNKYFSRNSETPYNIINYPWKSSYKLATFHVLSSDFTVCHVFIPVNSCLEFISKHFSHLLVFVKGNMNNCWLMDMDWLRADTCFDLCLPRFATAGAVFGLAWPTSDCVVHLTVVKQYEQHSNWAGVMNEWVKVLLLCHAYNCMPSPHGLIKHQAIK